MQQRQTQQHATHQQPQPQPQLRRPTAPTQQHVASRPHDRPARAHQQQQQQQQQQQRRRHHQRRDLLLAGGLAHQQQQQRRHHQRRDVLLAGGLACVAPLLAPSGRAQASVPEVAAAGAWGLPFVLPTPEPVRFPRKTLNLRLAVLLMRSSFDAVDALDFIPMDKFEAKFWKLRQSELEGYKLLYAPLTMRQGDLTDPLYLDFISFSQYSTISRAMAQPISAFSEYKEVCPPGAGPDDPCDAGSQLIQRPPQFAEDAKLPLYFFETAGALIYQGLRDGFQGEVFGGPQPPAPGASIVQLAAGAQQLLDSMVAKGYAIGATVTDVRPDGWTAKVSGPCCLWAMAALRARNAAVVNAYDVMATAAWLRAGGRRATHELELSESGLLQRWTVVG